MPAITNLSSTSLLTAQLAQLFTPNTITSNSSTTVIANNGVMSFGFVGTGLVSTQVGGFLAGFSAGIIDSLTIRSVADGSVLARMTGLAIDVAVANTIFASPDAFEDYLATLVWTISGTAGADVYNLSNLAGFHATGRNIITLNQGNDTARGGTGVDDINGGADNDTIIDSIGNDIARGGIGNDLLSQGVGATGNDRLFGDAGNDTINGGLGNDQIFGGANDDLIDGGAGSDRISAGAGRDTQTGGGGADIFIFATGQGVDLITDFNLALDTINVTGSVIITEVDGDAVLRIGSTRVTLDGITAASLVMGDHIVLL